MEKDAWMRGKMKGKQRELKSKLITVLTPKLMTEFVHKLKRNDNDTLCEI